jgi:hypothetical protein
MEMSEWCWPTRAAYLAMKDFAKLRAARSRGDPRYDSRSCPAGDILLRVLADARAKLATRAGGDVLPWRCGLFYDRRSRYAPRAVR